MSKNFNNQVLAVSQKVYGWLLRAYPPRHREDYGPAMAQLFRDQGRDAWNEAQRWGMVKLWLRVLPDLINTSITERLAAFNPRKSMSDKMTALLRPLASPMTGFFTAFTIVFLLVLLVSVVITFILPESYASTARIKVEPDTPPAAGQPSYDPYFIQTTFEVIQSQMVLNRVIDKLNLKVQWGKKYFAGQTLKTNETLDILKQRLQLAPVRNTTLIAITVYSDDRKEAAQIANAVAESYASYRSQVRNELATKALAVMQQQYQQQEKQIQQAQTDVAALQGKFGIAGNVSQPDVATLEAEALKKQNVILQLSGRLAALRSLDKKRLPDVLPAAVDDQLLSDLIGKLREAEQQYAMRTNDYAPNHPSVTRITALIGVLTNQIDDRVTGLVGGLEAQLSAHDAASADLARTIETLKPAPETKPYWDAKHDLEQLRKSHELLFARIEAEKLDAQIPKPALVQITDAAEPGRAPVRPNKPLNIFLGAVAGGFLGLLAGAASALVSFKFGNRGQKNPASA